MFETAIVIAIVIAAAYFSLWSVIRTLTGKKACCNITSDGCGPCSFIDPDSEVEDEGGSSTIEKFGG